MINLTKSEQAIVEYADWADAHMQWKVTSNRTHRLKTIRSLEAKGILRNIGEVFMQDDDGFMTDPEHTRTGWELTELGKSMAEAIQGQQRIEFEARLAGNL